MASESSKRDNLGCILQDTKAGPRYLSLQDLRHITDDFSDERELGRGGFGVVYKGVLDTGEVVAVKRIAYTPDLKEGQFKNEVCRLMVVKHPNIVRFLGYCYETRHMCVKHEGKLCFAEMTERLVCLEYVPNKSLQNHISDESCGLDWHERYKIIKGVCRGLHYLHEESPQNTPIIHSDLKPANILLTKEMEPKITDFGQSRLFGEHQSRTCTKSFVGTLGYMAREHLHYGIITKKTDIFSLGVIIIEIITGHREYPESTGKSTQNFVEMVLEKWKKRLEDLGCTSLEEDCQQIKTCIEIGLRCVQMNEAQRPTAEEIVNILSGSMNLQVINEKRSPPTEQVDPPALIEAESSKQNVRSNSSTANETPPYVFPSRGFRICAGCQNPIGHGRFLSCMDPVWHPQCFTCFSCNKPISEYEFAMHDDHPYHRSCYKEFFHPKCDVCNNFIFPTKRDSLVEYRAHPFWMHKYCPSHEDDGTPRCCSWERMEDDTYHGCDNEDIDHAIALSLAEEDQNKGKAAAVDTDYNLEEDEQLARALQESLNAESPRPVEDVPVPPRWNVPVERVPPRLYVPANEPPPHVYPQSGSRICAGCQNPIGHGRFLSCMDSVWHPQCFRCFSCNKPISEYEFAMHDDQPYHKSCYEEFFHPKCDVCNNFIPTNRDGLIEYRAHPFWMQKYCPSHEDDGTPRCCSCERMEPREIKYITLDDGRKLCLECLNSAIMDTPECQHLYMDIQEFFEGLTMKVEQQIPLLLVEGQALKEALEAEKNGPYLPGTHGLCLSEEQIVRTILKRPKIELGNQIIDMITEPYKLSRRREVTAILILYGLPRLLTSSILAHEMMHAYLRLKGFRNLSAEVEEGICQVLSHMWLESEIIASSSSNVASSSEASLSSSSSAPTSSKKGAKTEFEKKLGAFFKYQIETDSSEAYGDGFRAGYLAVERYGLKRTLDHIKLTGSFPY